MDAGALISTARFTSELNVLVEQALATGRRRPARPVAFIERKSPDFEQLAEILRLSADRGSWANFGPVSRLLESSLEQHLNLPSSRAVVTCSSGTAALLALIGLKEYRAHRRLRWVISAFGFRASCLGPLANARIVDCDPTGILDLDALAALDPDSWDGVVITNTFGLRSDLRDHIEFCASRNKELIVDNAGLLNGFLRDDPDSTADEILSFHQTKPWGMGEGGCVILPREQAPEFRAIINGGHGLGPEARLWASNSKICDVSCALILQRLLQMPEWSCAYREQACRILTIALCAGLRPLAPIDLDTLTLPHLPMLASSPVAEADLVNESFVMQKYYQPLSNEPQVAASIYAGIVNIPCHPDMALLRDQEIRSVLDRLPGGRS
jgi:dTDP-4-amino-4,6-dideoxygalactose transaminase